MDFFGNDAKGFAPLGMATFLRNSQYDKPKHWAFQRRLLAAGCLSTARLTRGNIIGPMIETMCKEAPIVRGIQTVGVVASEKQANPRGSYIIGDQEDLAACWATSDRGLYWTAMSPSHWYVPYIDFDEYNDTDCFLDVWERVGPAITIVGDALVPLTGMPTRPEFTMTYNKRIVDQPRPGLWKFSFHVHFHELICEDIQEWKAFLSGLPVPRRRLWKPFEEQEPFVELSSPLYDLSVYGGRTQLFRGPYCGKAGNALAVMKPIRVCDEYDNSDLVFVPREVEAETKAEYILRCRISVPPTNEFVKLRFVTAQPERLVTSAPAAAWDIMSFWVPLVEAYILPAWQQFRASLASTINGLDGCTIPVSSLSVTRLAENNQPPHIALYTIANDTFCEMDAKHCHSGGTHPIRCVIDFVHGSIWQGCRACDKNGKKYHFLRANEIVIVEPDALQTRATLVPFCCSRYHHFIQYYYSELFVRTQLSTAALVYDQRNGLWVDGDDGNALVGELVTQCNDKYAEYARYVEDHNMKARIQARVEILVQSNPPDFGEQLEKAKVEEKAEAEKRLAKAGPLLPYTLNHRSQFLRDLRAYPCKNEIDDMDPHTHLVPMKNNTCYNIYTGETRAITQRDYFTSICNAELTRDATEIKEIEGWFYEIGSGNPEKITLLKRVAAYLMTMQTHDRKFYVLQGNGKNGKGAFKSFLCAILSAPRSPSRWASLPHAFWETQRNCSPENASPVSYGLKDKTLYYTDDMPRFPVAAGKIKSIVAHEVMSGRALYCKPIKFTPKGKILWTANPFPGIPGDDNASWERYVLIPFTSKYVEAKENPALWRFKQDRVRMDRLLTYTDAFFTVAMTALTAYYQETMTPGSATPSILGPLPIPDDLVEVRKQARHRELPLARFVDIHLAPTDEESQWTTTTQAFDTYLTFLETENETTQKKRTTHQIFENMLSSAMDFTVVDSVIHGYRLVFTATLRCVRPRYD